MFFFLCIDEFNSNENFGLIKNLKINYDKKNFLIFPNEFSIGFNEFQKNFSIVFKKLDKNHLSYPIKSSNIYVIDDRTGQPVIFDHRNGNVT